MKKLFLLLCIMCALCSCGSSEPNKENAKNAARAAIIQNLKNPTDVKFHHDEHIVELGYNTFQYNETVNATNSFGGSIKQQAAVKIKYIKGDATEVSNWEIQDIHFY